MTQLHLLPDIDRVTSAPPTGLSRRRVALSPKQRVVLDYVREHSIITLDLAVVLFGGDLYANAHRHVGALLSRMVARGLLVRTKPGLFHLPPRAERPAHLTPSFP